jgi:carbon-monoxide dehydrogenase medium subunit
MGGSLVHADPAADWAVTLTALNAELDVLGSAGTRRVALTSFFEAPFTTTLAPGEIVTRIRIMRRGPSARWGYYKFQQKVGEFAQASAAVLIDPAREEMRIAVGALEACPLVLPDPRAVLTDPRKAESQIAMALPPREGGWALHGEAVRRAINLAAGSMP